LTGPDTEARIGELIETVTAVRNIRSELGIALGTPVTVRIAADGQGDRVRAIEGLMKTLAKVRIGLLGRRSRLWAVEYPASRTHSGLDGRASGATR